MVLKKLLFLICNFTLVFLFCFKCTYCLQFTKRQYNTNYQSRILMHKYIDTIRSIEFSTIQSPPKTGTEKNNDIKIEPPQIQKNNDIQKANEEYIEESNDQYMVILYDDPVNKRVYVAAVLMTVFTWSEDMANSVMFRAHSTGFAVTGEWAKDIAEDYWKKLIQKGLIAEVVKSKDMNSMDGNNS